MFLGFDTSNYTTSVAFFDGKEIFQKKKLLEVKAGERGLRQSDAVFQHTVNLPVLMKMLTEELDFKSIRSVGVSTRPRNIDGSYMPCFLVGESNAVCVSSVNKVPLYKTSHQVGHILAALYSIDRLDLIKKPFVAFHVSGGTTEALLVTPDDEEIIKAELIAESTDLKAGQAVEVDAVPDGLVRGVQPGELNDMGGLTGGGGHRLRLAEGLHRRAALGGFGGVALHHRHPDAVGLQIDIAAGGKSCNAHKMAIPPYLHAAQSELRRLVPQLQRIMSAELKL